MDDIFFKLATDVELMLGMAAEHPEAFDRESLITVIRSTHRFVAAKLKTHDESKAKAGS